MELRKDQEIFKEVLEGNQDSFRILFNRYYKSLCLYADAFLHSMSESEDIVQKIYIRIWENKENLHHINSIKHYLYQATRNSCYNVLKHRKIEEKQLAAMQLLEKENLTNTIQNEEEKFRKLHHAINELPSKTRQVLELNIFENLSYEVIARNMNISVNTVKYHIKTAYERLRKINFKNI